jgi:putative DNA primase/helicase
MSTVPLAPPNGADEASIRHAAYTPATAGVATPPTETEVVARLSALAPMDYDRLRKEEAKALGIQVKTLDELVRAARSDTLDVGRLPFVEHEPADEPVDPARLFDDITALVLRYVVLDLEQAHAATLWVAHTHLTDAANVSPLAIINAPERACAKTLFQTLLSRLCYRPLPASNASLSALFRAVERWKPTILIDEADTFFRENAELHGMVNAGYMRGGYVLRSEATGDSFEPRLFSVYGAKSIAGIALERHLPDATMSRGIVFNMRRKLQHESVERMRNADDAVFARLGRQLARFAADHSQQVRLARPHLPDRLSDRAQDNWEPLLAIAACAGPVWLQRATAAALKMSAASESMSSTGNDLLADIKDVFDNMGATKISTVELLERLTGDEEKSWATYNRGKPMTPRQLAKQLEIYGIKSKTVRMGPKSTPKGYEVAQFEDAFRRYLKPPSGEPDPAEPPGTAVAETPPHRAHDAPVPPVRGAVADTSDTPAAPDPEDRF